jgi:uncharacterized membrane protein YkoI
MKNYACASLAIPALLFMACSSANGDAQPESSSRSSTPSSNPSSSNQASNGTSLSAQQQLLQQNVAAAELSLAEATDIALAANPGAEVRETDLDRDDGELRYEIELRLADGSLIEVHVDAVTGDILRSVPEDDDDDDDGDDDDDRLVDCSTAISADEATTIAEAEAGGSAVRVEADDDCDFEIVVDTGAGLVEVDVAPDGSVTEVDDDDDGIGDDDDGIDDGDDDDGIDDDDDDGDDVDGDDD